MHKSKNRQDVCVIGLGNMGSALAEALLTGGHKVTLWNRTGEKCEPFKELGADVAASASEALDASDVAVLCVLDNEASNSILTGTGMDAALQGKTVLQFTTLEPSAAQVEDRWMRERGARYLECAILGFPADVRTGTAQMAFSGTQDVLEESKELIDCVADNVGRRRPPGLVYDDRVGLGPGVRQPVQILMMMEWISPAPVDQPDIWITALLAVEVIGRSRAEQHVG
ncbi:MAG: NAD(P)-dependent oxidoreductase [Alphaproteobacteria bacterium]|nr:NAD(P)-dependent oxidoreductase [Alphaproteobacteria bacterium]